MPRLRNFIVSQIAILIGLLCGSTAWAGHNKLDVTVGSFSITAKTASKSGKASGIGLYQIGYRYGFTSGLEMSVSYTLCFSGIISGDSVAGLSFGMNYYPFSTASVIEGINEQGSFSYDQIWRPFVGLSLNQRNFQSTQATYNGLGANLGIERALGGNLHLQAAIRYMILSGARDSTASEADFYTGIGFKF